MHVRVPEPTFTNYHAVLALLGVCLVYGAVGVAGLLWRAIVFAYRAWLRAPHDLVKRYGGGWAVVTGATDGIGKALAMDLARKGFHVVLVSRTQEKLDECKKELLSKCPKVRCETMRVDFSAKGFGPAERKQLEGTLKALPDGGVAILVNNVGVSYDFPCFFDELDEQRVDDLTRLNCDSTAFLTHMVLKIMLGRNVPRGCKKGAIMNVGSSAGLFANPLLSQYGAAKAYIQKLTEGLAVEYKAKGIDVQVTTPFFIVSKLSKFKRPSMTVPSAERFSRLLLNCVGYETVVNPHVGHALMGFVLKAFPWTGSVVLKHHLGIRSKAMKKKQGAGGGAGDETKKEL